jgi:hypothetical protein
MPHCRIHYAEEREYSEIAERKGNLDRSIVAFTVVYENVTSACSKNSPVPG